MEDTKPRHYMSKDGMECKDYPVQRCWGPNSVLILDERLHTGSSIHICSYIYCLDAKQSKGEDK